MRNFMLAAIAATALPTAALAQIDPDALRDAALKDEIAWDITEGITTEIGPRLAGTEAEARARAWAVKKLAALGFSNVRNEPFPMKTWVRGEERLEVLAPFAQPLTLTALGNSGATGSRGLEAEVVYFPDLAALQAAPDGSLKGKIAFVSHSMTRTQDGSQYGAFGAVRRSGPATASRKGAAAILIRSVGTDYHRNPHAGGTNFPAGVAPIPAAALSLPDAEQLERIVKRGQPVKVKLTLTPRQIGTTQSGNVIAEVPGSDPAAGIVLVACHLDSWDLGTGAFDDAAGCGIVTAAAKRIMDAGQPRRTIRILWAGAEEVGVFGGTAYFEKHKVERHAAAAESDFGADRIWRVDFKFPAAAKPVADRVATALSPLGIARGKDPASGGADVSALVASGVPGIDLQQDGTRYFDLHHTPDDTLDKVDPVQLRQNVAAWTAMLAVVANAPEPLGAAQ
ncbi:M28 family peptidase [Sphingomonas turrisvirgatae]|uniref:Carboxypeptidase Q n=1 Tax=Sphingomonas turrisvirgatae TaxID=1888892 RepID=A0A1E3LZU2_9SPHN|nr:M28 family peptidase [Sphingomonas turrisvirgatae]ODP39336.1 peptidase M28 [Sphingomonas turrisvirgatae]